VEATLNKYTMGVVAVLGVLAVAGAPTAHAKGCIKGAIVGGLAGHVVHHGLLGAAGGCLVGRHMAKKHQQDQHHDYSGGDPNHNY
jgi:hypothetical protein